MTIQTFLNTLRKRIWIVVLTTLIALAAAYLVSEQITPTYQSQTTLLIGQLTQGPDVNSNSSVTDAQLAQTHALLAKKPNLLTAVATTLNYPGGWQDLFFKVETQVTGGQVLAITVTDNDPVRAKQIADEIAHQLIVLSPLNAQNQESSDQQAFAASEQSILKSQIQNARDKLNKLNAQAAIENDPPKLKDLNDQIGILQTNIDKWQASYISISELLKTQNTSFITILLPADLPTVPVSPNIPRNLFLAALAGLALGGGLIFGLEYMDNTIKSPDDTQRLLDTSTLAIVTRMKPVRQPSDTLITAKHPRSPTSEAFRSLRTNLRFAGLENPNGTLLVTSAGPGEGKSTIAANLAVAMAQAGKRIVLVDADLRRPSMHKIFGLTNNVGLSDLFLEEPPALDDVLQKTGVSGLRVLTSGKIPPNPAEMLDSKLMNEIITNLRRESDMVVFDSPPLLAVSDASIIGARCSGAVLVIDAGHTRSEIAERAVDSLGKADIHLYGAVLNRQSEKRAYGYYYYQYYSAADSSKDKSN